VLVTESITPQVKHDTEIRVQPSMMSVPSAASTVAPEQRRSLGAQPAPKAAARRKLWFFTAVSVLVGVAGAAAIGGTPRISTGVHSGSPGYRQSSTGHDLRWANKPLTIYLDQSLARLGPGGNEAVIQAFGQWVGSDARLPHLSFDSGKTSTTPLRDGKSTVSYGRITATGHEHDVAITVSYADDKTGEIIEADIILNALYPMGVLTPKLAEQTTTDGARERDDGQSTRVREEALDCQNRYDAQNVTTHEVGHFFGLGEDPVKSQAAMFQIIDQCETHKRALAPTDVDALGVLYAESETPEEAQAGARSCSFGGVPASGGALAVSSAIFGLALLRRRRAR
jgi:hypothetical protein